MKPLDFDELAVHVSRFHFCKIFKKSTGMTLTEYVARIRIEKAMAMIADPSLRITEVVFASGFGSIPQFNGDECILCGDCADVCPEACLRLVDAVNLRGNESLQAAFLSRYERQPARGEHGAIIKDETRCIRCGLCAVRCPTGAITMERVELIPA